MDVQPRPELVVVIPTRGRSETLGKVVEGVLAQEDAERDFEVIVVDDSREGLLQLDVPDLRVLRSKGAGLNAARNLALDSSEAELICFLDDDVDVSAGWLAAMERAWDEDPGPNCFGGRIRLRLEGSPPRLCSRCASRPLATSLDLEPGARPLSVWGANFSVTRSAIELAGRFDEALRLGGDEVEWQLRLRRAGGRVVYVHDAWVWHRRLPEQLGIRTLLRSNFKRGRNNAFTQARTGTLQHNPWRAMLASCGHSLIRGCWGGLLRAANLAGHQVGRVEGRRSLQ